MFTWQIWPHDQNRDQKLIHMYANDSTYAFQRCSLQMRYETICCDRLQNAMPLYVVRRWGTGRSFLNGNRKENTCLCNLDHNGAPTAVIGLIGGVPFHLHLLSTRNIMCFLPCQTCRLGARVDDNTTRTNDRTLGVQYMQFFSSARLVINNNSQHLADNNPYHPQLGSPFLCQPKTNQRYCYLRNFLYMGIRSDAEPFWGFAL